MVWDLSLHLPSSHGAGRGGEHEGGMGVFELNMEGGKSIYIKGQTKFSCLHFSPIESYLFAVSQL